MWRRATRTGETTPRPPCAPRETNVVQNYFVMVVVPEVFTIRVPSTTWYPNPIPGFNMLNARPAASSSFTQMILAAESTRPYSSMKRTQYSANRPLALRVHCTPFSLATLVPSEHTGRATSVALKWYPCLLYTSDAADDLLCVDLGGRRII